MWGTCWAELLLPTRSRLEPFLCFLLLIGFAEETLWEKVNDEEKGVNCSL